MRAIVLRRGIALLGLAVLAIAAVGVALGLSFRDGGRGHGPLVLPARGEVSIGAPVPLSKAYSYGLLNVTNGSERPLTLDRASLERVGSGISLIGAYGLPVPNHQGIGFVRGYHVPREGHQLNGLRVAPHTEVQLILGLKVTREGRHEFEAVRLDYHDRGRSFSDSYPTSGRLCAPFRRYVDNCEGLLDERRRE